MGVNKLTLTLYFLLFDSLKNDSFHITKRHLDRIEIRNLIF